MTKDVDKSVDMSRIVFFVNSVFNSWERKNNSRAQQKSKIFVPSKYGIFWGDQEPQTRSLV